MAWISKKSADKYRILRWKWMLTISKWMTIWWKYPPIASILWTHHDNVVANPYCEDQIAVCYFLQFDTCVYIVCSKKDPHSDLQWRQRLNSIAVYICLLLISTNTWDLTQSMQPIQQLFYIITLSPRPMSIWFFFQIN